jgi:hypothetical protein
MLGARELRPAALPRFLPDPAGLPAVPVHAAEPQRLARREALVYYLLFPVLLFHSIVKSPLDWAATST